MNPKGHPESIPYAPPGSLGLNFSQPDLLGQAHGISKGTNF